MSLPVDAIVEILTRLPVRSLIRFKCVCKSWHALVNSPHFISHHYQTISFKEDYEVLLVSRRHNITNQRVISLLRRDGNGTFVDQDSPPVLNGTFGHVRLLGPCNGVVCLYGYPDNIALWNPILHDFKMLTPSQVPRPDAKVLFGDVGLGFDSITRDFKVMQILYCICSCNVICQVEIYSLRTNSWRKYQCTIPAEIKCFGPWSMVHKDETFCWWANNNASGNEVILSFDMKIEVFQTTPLPNGIEALGGEHRITRSIVPMKDYVALIVYSSLKEVDRTFNVWILKELGGSVESWTKLSSIGPISDVTRPLGFWNGGEFILESSCGELVVYDSRRNEIKNFGVYGKRSRLEALVYKESLFSVNEVHLDG